MDPHLTSVLGFSTAITAQTQSGQSANEPLPRRDPNDIAWLQQALEAQRPKDEPTQMKVNVSDFLFAALALTSCS